MRQQYLKMFVLCFVQQVCVPKKNVTKKKAFLEKQPILHAWRPQNLVFSSPALVDDTAGVSDRDLGPYHFGLVEMRYRIRSTKMQKKRVEYI